MRPNVTADANGWQLWVERAIARRITDNPVNRVIRRRVSPR